MDKQVKSMFKYEKHFTAKPNGSAGGGGGGGGGDIIAISLLFNFSMNRAKTSNAAGCW